MVTVSQRIGMGIVKKVVWSGYLCKLHVQIRTGTYKYTDYCTCDEHAELSQICVGTAVGYWTSNNCTGNLIARFSSGFTLWPKISLSEQDTQESKQTGRESVVGSGEKGRRVGWVGTEREEGEIFKRIWFRKMCVKLHRSSELLFNFLVSLFVSFYPSWICFCFVFACLLLPLCFHYSIL